MADNRNQLLASLSTDDLDLLEPHLETVNLGLRKHLEKPNKRIEAVYFPESGFASVVAVQSTGKQVEVGLIGREGMTGLPVCKALNLLDGNPAREVIAERIIALAMTGERSPTLLRDRVLREAGLEPWVVLHVAT
jgi:hypothetical protein